MALVCDICNQEVRAGTGYALTTKQVVTNPKYWEYAFGHQWAYLGEMHEFLGEKMEGVEALAGTVSTQASNRTPWLVCDKCIDIFQVDRTRAQELAKKLWSAPNATRTGWKQDTGDAPFDKSLEAAAEAWIKIFRKSPIPALKKQASEGGVYGSAGYVHIDRELLQRLEQKLKKPRKAAATGKQRAKSPDLQKDDAIEHDRAEADRVVTSLSTTDLAQSELDEEHRRNLDAFISVLNAGLASSVMKRIAGAGIGQTEMQHALELLLSNMGTIETEMGRPDVIAAFIALAKAALVKRNILEGNVKTLLECDEPGELFPFINENALSGIRFAHKQVIILKIRDISTFAKKSSARNSLLTSIQKADIVVAPNDFKRYRITFAARDRAWLNVLFGAIYYVEKTSYKRGNLEGKERLGVDKPRETKRRWWHFWGK